MRSPTLLLIKMNAAETSASSAIADWTPLTVVSRSLTTAEIDTFMIEVSTTNTNIAIASRTARRGFQAASSEAVATAVADIRISPLVLVRSATDRHSPEQRSTAHWKQIPASDHFILTICR